MVRYVVLSVVTIALGTNAFVYHQLEAHEMKKITIHNHQKVQLEVEVADSSEERYVGLMYREELAEGKGMLFVYDEPVLPSFWMKNTLIPLDMIFIDSKKRIKYIEHSVPPCPPKTACPTYAPPKKVQYVLEVPGGYAEKNQISEGQVVQFN